jgi:DNA-binding response OmpR family regulator
VQVLVVDDEPEIRALMCEVLESAGYECLLARDAEEACRSLGSEDLGLLITDVDLGGGGSGIEVARRAREKDRTLPVLYVTSSTGPRLERFAVQGAKTLAKPFEIDALLDLAGRLVRAA